MTQLTNALDGVGLEYTYTDGGALEVTFHNGLIDYGWIRGPFQGTTGRDLAYQARSIAEGIYLVNFHLPEEGNFAALVVDLNGRVVMRSELVGYKSGEPITRFDVATITKATGRDA